jgi:hypothetical protein
MTARSSRPLPAATPGPWTANLESDHGDYTIWGPASNDDFIANVGTEPEANRIVAFDVSEANARLISAAPDLLLALRRAVGHLDCWNYKPNVQARDCREGNRCPACRVAADARAAIAKAEGR